MITGFALFPFDDTVSDLLTVQTALTCAIVFALHLAWF